MNAVPPEMRYWRTDTGRGRNVYALLSNDIMRPSDEDPLLGIMESSAVAENMVNTHNGALSLYGRRYPEVLAEAEKGPSMDKAELYLKLGRGEHDQLFKIAEWLFKGPVGTHTVIEKLFRALGGTDG
jgi:hypothetical protein